MIGDPARHVRLGVGHAFDEGILLDDLKVHLPAVRRSRMQTNGDDQLNPHLPSLSAVAAANPLLSLSGYHGLAPAPNAGDNPTMKGSSILLPALALFSALCLLPL